MKKLISLLLVVMLVVSMAVTASAAAGKTEKGLNTTDKKTSTNSVDVKIDTESIAHIDAVYYVDIVWDSLDFEYSFKSDENNEWDPKNHSYGSAEYTGDSWNKTAANIVVTNHSNKAVNIAAAIDVAAKNGVTATLSNASFGLATGEGRAPDDADAKTITVNIKGVPNTTSNFTIGTITVTVSAA